jgi:hypothetical protein
MTRPLRSTTITAASSLLRSSPPLSGASVLSALRLAPLGPFSLGIAGQVLTFLTRAWLSFAPSTCRMSFLDGSLALASLNRACRDHRPDVSAALTTMAFDQSGPRWLGISDLIAEPEGPTFISYKVARCRLDRLRFVTQDPLRKSRNCATLTLCLFRAQKLTSFATRGLFRRILPVLSCSFGSGQFSG